jgi:DNA-binding NarL/FixJ family response regulator
MIRAAVVDDHPHVAIALRALLDQTADIRLVAEARQGSEVFCSGAAQAPPRPVAGPAHRT